MKKTADFFQSTKNGFACCLLHAVHVLSLDLVSEIKVALVKVVHTDVTVLTTTGVAPAGRVGGDGVKRTEVTTNTADFVLEDLVVETSLEFTLASGGSGDFHGGLTTTKDDKVLLGGNGCAVERGIAGVRLEDFEVAGGKELGVLVLAGGDEVGAVSGPL